MGYFSKKEHEEYYVGLDMGTSSIGWAVTDTSYNLVRSKGKDMWGVRLFSEAETASDRRSKRAARRNLQRRKVREGLLKLFFLDEILKLDPSFFVRLEESKYYLEDKTNQSSYVLFNDDNFNDEQYYLRYPTIFHLISELIHNKEPHDVRLVFLACLNIFKHRGHFLNDNLEGNGLGNISDLTDSLFEAIDVVNEVLGEDCIIISEKETFVKSLKEILPSKDMSNSAKQKEIENCLNLGKTQKNIKEMLKLICGLNATISTIFPKEEYEDEQVKFKISFRDSNFEDKIVKVEEMLSDSEYDVICILKRIHDWAVVFSVMKGFEYLSDSRIASFKKHQEDLLRLKKIYKLYAADKYDDMFRKMTDNNYSSYVGKTSSTKKAQTDNKKTRKQRRGAKCTQEELYKKIKFDLKDVPDEIKQNIIKEIDNGSFLQKQISNVNGAIPYQLHSMELKALLSNASTYLPFLREQDEDGLTIMDKIIMLFEFRVPYYIGPVYNDGKHNAWSVRKAEGKVYPWNFEKMIDKKASAERFIEQMVRRCTYLNDETALPKESLKYERFRVLNELNNLKINGERVTTEIKQSIFNDVFKKNKKKVTKAKIKEYLVNCKGFPKDTILSGIDDTCANALLSYGKFLEIFKVNILTDTQEMIAEDIIKWSTVYGESKAFLEEKIRENYGDASANSILNDAQIKRVMGLKFKDWGRLSKEFLDLEGADKDNGEIMTIIRRMWETSYNLMELLSEKFTYKDALSEKINNLDRTLNEIEYADIDGLYISSPVKRMTWQTILVLQEIYEIMGYPPTKIFVEMARSEEEKINGKGKRKDSRRKRLEELYKACKDDTKIMDSLKTEEDADLRRKKLYLYYLQKGKCMYSGETIDIDSLYTDAYDIDHIYPQSVTPDDSVENNMVLVKRELNNQKSNNFPIFAEWRNRMTPFWESLRKQNFLNEEKFKRLTRSEVFTDEELAAFVNRQLVETRQGTKVIAELLQKTFQDKTRIVYSKADNVSKFRYKFSKLNFDKSNQENKESGAGKVLNPEFVKCRLINDLHHAKDAYLNIVVGNVYDVKFTQSPLNYIKEYRKAEQDVNSEQRERYHMDKIFNFQVERGGVVAWRRRGEKEQQSIYIVSKTLKKNTPLVTRMSYEEKGELFDLTIYGAEAASSKDGVGYVQVKTTEAKLKVERYGGYKKFTGTYFFLVEHTEKKKRVRTLEVMPLYLVEQINDKGKLEKWCQETLGLMEPIVKIEKIKMYSKMYIDGFYYYLTGRSNKQLLVSNAVQLKLDEKWNEYVKIICSESLDDEKIDYDKNVELYDLLIQKHCNGIYSKRANPIGDKMIKQKAAFLSYSLRKQIDVLVNIIHMSASGNQGVDLGDGTKAGVMQFHKRISDRNSVKLINQSITGLFENEIDLLTV